MAELKLFRRKVRRVVESSERKSLDDVVSWARQQIKQIKKTSDDKDFLEAFAQLVELDIVWNNTQPTAVLAEPSFVVDNLLEMFSCTLCCCTLARLSPVP